MPALHMLPHKHLKWEAVAAPQSPCRVWAAALAAGGRQSPAPSPRLERVEVSAGNCTSFSLIRRRG